MYIKSRKKFIFLISKFLDKLIVVGRFPERGTFERYRNDPRIPIVFANSIYEAKVFLEPH